VVVERGTPFSLDNVKRFNLKGLVVVELCYTLMMVQSGGFNPKGISGVEPGDAFMKLDVERFQP